MSDTFRRETFSLVIVSLTRFQKTFPARVLEWQMAFTMLLCGYVLSLPQHTFDLPPYQALRELADERTWMLICFWLGGARLALLGVNGALPRGSPHLRAAFAVFCGGVWVMLWVGFWSAGFPTLLFAFVPVAACSEIVNIARAAIDAKAEDTVRGRKNGVV